MAAALAQSHASIQGWFEDWVSDVRLWEKMFERDPGKVTAITNPFTGEAVVVHGKRLRRQLE
jgi:hypothetical protein